jgi:uncharacterized protein YegP (UPF0339 family)
MIPRLFATSLLGLGCLTACLDAQSDVPKRPAGSIDIIKIREGEYGYRVKNADGKTLLLPPNRMYWSDAAGVLKVIQEITIMISTPPIEDPVSKEEFKNKEFRYSFRIKDANGAIIAVPPQEMQWTSKTELFDAAQELRAILEAAAPAEPERPMLKGNELKASSDNTGGMPPNLTKPAFPKAGFPKAGLPKKNAKK